MGLGLLISKGIVIVFGGSIVVVIVFEGGVMMEICLFIFVESWVV